MDNVFQSNCSSHAKLMTNLRKIEKPPKMRHKMVMHPALQFVESTPLPPPPPPPQAILMATGIICTVDIKHSSLTTLLEGEGRGNSL